MLTLIVLCRILTNPFSNAFQKLLTARRADPLFVIFATHAGLTILCLPLLLVSQPHLSAAFLWNMVAVAVLTVSGNAMLVQAVKLSDLSVLGPVRIQPVLIPSNCINSADGCCLKKKARISNPGIGPAFP
jgi:hypothetical protein